MGHKYFCFAGESFRTFATADEAQGEAEAAIEGFRDRASERWPEEVEAVCWGRIAAMTDRLVLEPKDGREMWDYALVQIDCPGTETP